MNIRELQSALHLLQEMYAAGGAQKQADSLSQLIEALDGHAHESVEAFIDRARCDLGTPEGSVRQANPKIPNSEVVERHVNDLIAAENDRVRFDRAFASLKSDTKARLLECEVIARAYKNRPTGGTFAYKFDSKNKALEFIQDTYLGRSQEESKAGIIEKLTKWASG